jgi:large subunit ribosomal protein L23
MKDLHSVIKTIRLSEKATLLGERNNEYVFIRRSKATKIDIKQAVEKLFGKKVTGSPHRQLLTAKPVVSVAPTIGRTNHWKKAIVRLKDGEKLDLV